MMAQDQTEQAKGTLEADTQPQNGPVKSSKLSTHGKKLKAKSKYASGRRRDTRSFRLNKPSGSDKASRTLAQGIR